jgi:hypothetical protein
LTRASSRAREQEARIANVTASMNAKFEESVDELRAAVLQLRNETLGVAVAAAVEAGLKTMQQVWPQRLGTAAWVRAAAARKQAEKEAEEAEEEEDEGAAVEAAEEGEGEGEGGEGEGEVDWELLTEGKLVFVKFFAPWSEIQF